MHKPRLALAAILSALLLSLSLTASASAGPKLKLTLYDCWGYNYYTGFLDYKGSIKLQTKGRYEHAFGRKKRKLTDKTTGTWKYTKTAPKGTSRIRFSKGAMNKTTVEVVRDTKKPKRTFFNILLKGKPSGISCYVVEKP
jgi:hypothetical protein